VAGITVTGGPFAFAASSAKPMDIVLADYVKIQDALASDNIQGVSAAAASIAKVGKDNKALHAAANELAKAGDLKAARAAMKGLSEIVSSWVRKNKPAGYEVYTCSMANAPWVQKAGSPRNPYYGKEMLECGEKLN
jgi:hypothetical protein